MGLCLPLDHLHSFKSVTSAHSPKTSPEGICFTPNWSGTVTTQLQASSSSCAPWAWALKWLTASQDRANVPSGSGLWTLPSSQPQHWNKARWALLQQHRGAGGRTYPNPAWLGSSIPPIVLSPWSLTSCLQGGPVGADAIHSLASNLSSSLSLPPALRQGVWTGGWAGQANPPLPQCWCSE